MTAPGTAMEYDGELRRSKSVTSMHPDGLPRTKSVPAIDMSDEQRLARSRTQKAVGLESKEMKKSESKVAVSESKLSSSREHKVGGGGAGESKRGGSRDGAAKAGEGQGSSAREGSDDDGGGGDASDASSDSGRRRTPSAGSTREGLHIDAAAAAEAGGRPRSAKSAKKKVLTPRSRIRTKMSLQLNVSQLGRGGGGGGGSSTSNSERDLVAVSPMATGGRDSARSYASSSRPSTANTADFDDDDSDESGSSFYTPRDDAGGRWMVGPDGIVEMPTSSNGTTGTGTGTGNAHHNNALDAIHSEVRPISAVDKSTASNARSKADDFLRLRKLGGGAGGMVYLAIHKKHLHLVALKTIDYTKAETQQQRRQEIERELTILHPNFVPLGQPDLKPSDYCDQLVSFHGAFTTERFITIILEFMCVYCARVRTPGCAF